ncbi:hypothetical protein Vafri_3844, partial [Volvox africanus]
RERERDPCLPPPFSTPSLLVSVSPSVSVSPRQRRSLRLAAQPLAESAPHPLPPHHQQAAAAPTGPHCRHRRPEPGSGGRANRPQPTAASRLRNPARDAACGRRNRNLTAAQPATPRMNSYRRNRQSEARTTTATGVVAVVVLLLVVLLLLVV